MLEVLQVLWRCALVCERLRCEPWRPWEYCSAVHEVRLDLEETGQPREDQIRFTLS